MKRKTIIHGCGRTDSGVHASQYFAHVNLPGKFDFDFLDRINLVLPPDIAMYDLIPVDEKNHAQYDVKYRTYTYFFNLEKIPSKAHSSAYYKVDAFNTNLVHEALQIIAETSDFRSLCKQPDNYKHTRCEIENVNLEELDAYSYKLEIKADRFLRGMIRYIAARLIDIGTGRLDLDLFASTLSNCLEFDFRFQKQGFPQGLYLSKVEYPYLVRDSRMVNF